MITKVSILGICEHIQEDSLAEQIYHLELKVSLVNIIYQIKTNFGMAELHHKTPTSRGSPILFLHGFGSSGEIWFRYDDSLGNYLKSKGVDCWTLTLSNAVYANIIDLAQDDLLTSLDLIYRNTQQRVIIITHSMGGIITRVLTSPHFERLFDLQRVEEMIHGVSLLTVPNQGVPRGNHSRIEDFFNSIQQALGKEKLPADLGLGFFQLTPKSKLMARLNQAPKLNPKLQWLNAVGKFDWVVPVTSAFLPLEDVTDVPRLSQKEFPCDHMVYPFDNALRRLSQLAQKAIPDSTDAPWTVIESKITWRPAIHRFPPVGDWILKYLLPEISDTESV